MDRVARPSVTSLSTEHFGLVLILLGNSAAANLCGSRTPDRVA
jgi:hypothetical protein